MGVYIINTSTPGPQGIRPTVRLGPRSIPVGQRHVLLEGELEDHLVELHSLLDRGLISVRDLETGNPVELPPRPPDPEPAPPPHPVEEKKEEKAGVITSLEAALDPNRPPSLQEILTLTPHTAADTARRRKR